MNIQITDAVGLSLPCLVGYNNGVMLKNSVWGLNRCFNLKTLVRILARPLLHWLYQVNHLITFQFQLFWQLSMHLPTHSSYNPRSRWPSLIVGTGKKPSIAAGSQEEVTELLSQVKPNEKRRSMLLRAWYSLSM